jgi:hypothetical protein
LKKQIFISNIGFRNITSGDSRFEDAIPRNAIDTINFFVAASQSQIFSDFRNLVLCGDYGVTSHPCRQEAYYIRASRRAYCSRKLPSCDIPPQLAAIAIAYNPRSGPSSSQIFQWLY